MAGLIACKEAEAGQEELRAWIFHIGIALLEKNMSHDSNLHKGKRERI